MWELPIMHCRAKRRSVCVPQTQHAHLPPPLSVMRTPQLSSLCEPELQFFVFPSGGVALTGPTPSTRTSCSTTPVATVSSAPHTCLHDYLLTPLSPWLPAHTCLNVYHLVYWSPWLGPVQHHFLSPRLLILPVLLLVRDRNKKSSILFPLVVMEIITFPVKHNHWSGNRPAFTHTLCGRAHRSSAQIWKLIHLYCRMREAAAQSPASCFAPLVYTSYFFISIIPL